MENEAGNDETDASVAMTALKAVVALVFIGGMTFALVVGYAHFDDGSETPRFEQVEGNQFRFEVVNDWENPGPNHDEYNRTEIERLVFKYTNEERVAEGLEELEYTDEFVEVARGHSADMANNGYVGHVDSQGREFEERMNFENGMEVEACLSPEDRGRLEELRQEGMDIGEIPSPATGENAGATFYETEVEDERTGEVVVNENEDDIARTLVNDWMASPTHRENILDESWNSMSVGVYVSEGKTVFATQVFCGREIDI
jgi:uncharacterized protein YkwD